MSSTGIMNGAGAKAPNTRKRGGNVEPGPLVRVLDAKGLIAAGLAGSNADIYRKIASGDLPPGMLIGGRRVWRESSLVSFLDKLETQPAGGATDNLDPHAAGPQKGEE